MSLTHHEITLLREHFPGADDFSAAKARVEGGEPLAYVIGEWYFCGETYLLNDDCLIPRPDTEHLVEWLAEHAPRGGRIADLCTGSGCIAISTLVMRRDLTADGVDIAPRALEMAEVNAARNGVAPRFRAILGDVMTGQGLSGQYDVIVSNPPYIHTDVIDTLSVQVRAEPRRALDGGADGMDFYRAILARYLPHLAPSGVLLFEIGYDQAAAITALAAAHGFACQIRKDYGGNDRMAILTLPTDL